MKNFTIKRNKKMGKKGFAMAELLAVCVIILGIFTILFSNFLPLVAEYENRISYNSVTAQYAVHYMRIDLRKNFPDTFNDSDVNNNGYKVLWKDNAWVNTLSLNATQKGKLEKLIKEYGIEEMILTTYSTKTLKSKYQPSDGKLYKYIQYLPTYENVLTNNKQEDIGEPYRLILKSEKYGYATTGLLYEIVEPPKPNHPVLAGNMVAVRHYDSGCTIEGNDNGCWKTVSSEKDYADDWYNYDEKRWANSAIIKSDKISSYDEKDGIGKEIDMNDVLTMQVWIPRFAYTVWNYNSEGTVAGTKTKINIVFDEQNSDGTFKLKSEITCKDSFNKDGVSEQCYYQFGGEEKECTNLLCSGKQYVHPAFTLGDTELSGFWIGKFELAKPNSDILVKPNLNTLRNLRVGDFYNYLDNMNSDNNIYGFGKNDDTHMIKNMEWGAVSYFTYSKYGVCESEGSSCTGKVAINNHAGRLTGYGPSVEQWLKKQEGQSNYVPISYTYSNSNGYETSIGMLASTTNNVYGVYDMNGGGGDEYVMGNMMISDGTIPVDGNDMMSGFYPNDAYYSGFKGVLYDLDGDLSNYNSGFYSDANYEYPDSYYFDVYSYGDNLSDIKRSKLGDGIREIGDKSKWDAKTTQFLHVSKKADGDLEVMPWLTRGGGAKDGWDSFDFGIFNTFSESGGSRRFYTSRLVISVLDS